MTKRYYVANKFRFTLFVVLSIILMTVVLNFMFALNTADSLTKVEYVDHQVLSGDTLWNIAETYMTDYDDVRIAVYQLCEINDISAGELYEGMIIKVPVPIAV